MAGLLTRAIGGIAKGVGEGMIQKAKDAREQALLQWTRGNQVADRDAGFAHQDAGQAKLFGHEDTSQQAGFDHADTTLATTEAGADRRLGVSESGANTRNAASIAGAASNTQATIKGESDRQTAGAGLYGTPTEAPDGTMYVQNKNGEAVTLKDKATGQPIKALGKDIPEGAYSAAIKQSMDGDTVDQDKLTSLLQTIRASRLPDASKILPTPAPAPSLMDRIGNVFSPAPASAAPTGQGLTSNLAGAQPKPLTPPGIGSTGNSAPPSAPPKLSKVPNLQYSASKNQFRDPTSGAVYDLNGNPVKQ